MANLLFCRPEYIRNWGEVSTAGTWQTGYGAANLQDGRPSKPAKLSTGAATRIVWDFGQDVRVDGLLIPQHNFPGPDVEDYTITIAANGSDAWGSPAFATSAVAGLWDPDGLVRPLWADLRGDSGYAETGWRYWSINLPENDAAAHALGEVVWCGRLESLEYGPEWGLTREIVRREIVSEGPYGRVTGYDRGVRQWRIRMQVHGRDADVAALRGLEQSLRGMVGAFALVLDPDVDPLPLYAELEAPPIESFLYSDHHLVSLSVIERQRGLAL